MNFDDLQRVWQSPHNQPSPSQLTETHMYFLKTLRKRQRGTALFLTLIGSFLLLLTSMLVRQTLWPEPSHAVIHPRHEWGALLLLLLPWLGAACVGWLYLKHRQRHRFAGASIQDTVRALLDENRTMRLRYQVIGALNVVMLGLLPLVVHQLQGVGKAGDEILLPAYVLCPAIMLAVLTAMTVHYRRKLLPEKAQLEALLQP